MTRQGWAGDLMPRAPVKPAMGYYLMDREWDRVRYYMALGLGYEDIAIKLGIPPNTIKAFVLRGGK